VQGVFYGIKPAVVAVVLFAAWRIGSRAIKNGVLLAICAAAFVGIFFFDIGFPWIVLAAGILGAIGGKLMPASFQGRRRPRRRPQGLRPGADRRRHAAAAAREVLLGQARPDRFAFVAIGAAAMLALRGNADLYHMGEFFTKAAFLTIGGAYAVLPYVYQGGVEQYAWLTGPQMMDGLALGETTPGPLIMIVTWVGYLGGVAKSVAARPVASGLAGATVATFFTFLPSFLFIIAGGPLVEATRGDSSSPRR
jgi:chromate transporter